MRPVRTIKTNRRKVTYQQPPLWGDRTAFGKNSNHTKKGMSPKSRATIVHSQAKIVHVEKEIGLFPGSKGKARRGVGHRLARFTNTSAPIETDDCDYKKKMPAPGHGGEDVIGMSSYGQKGDREHCRQGLGRLKRGGNCPSGVSHEVFRGNWKTAPHCESMLPGWFPSRALRRPCPNAARKQSNPKPKPLVPRGIKIGHGDTVFRGCRANEPREKVKGEREKKILKGGDRQRP